MDLTEQPDSTGETIWPRPFTKQRFVIAGERKESDPALLTCNGACGKQHVKWTWHYKVAASSYQCSDCKTSRKWGLGFSY